MKARLPALTKNERKRAKAEIEKMVDEMLEQKHGQTMRRFLKISCHVLNEYFGYGRHRLSRFINEVGKLSAEADEDEIYWEHIDRNVIDYIGLPFEREQEE